MKTVIAGSRAIGRLSRQQWDYDRLVALIDEAVRQSKISITQIISGGAGGPAYRFHVGSLSPILSRRY